MKIDIWHHHHRHGVDTYLMVRHDDEPLHSDAEVIEAHGVDFEAGREDEYIICSVTSLEVPCSFSRAELGDLQFAMRAQRNRLQRQVNKPGVEGTEHHAKNTQKLERYLALLEKLNQQEKLCVDRKENVPGGG